MIDEYSAHKSAGKSATAIKQAMEAKINQLGCHNVSHHCSDTHDVIDVAPSSIADQAAFRLALDAALKNGTIDKYITPPEDPAYHIEVNLSPTTNESDVPNYAVAAAALRRVPTAWSAVRDGLRQIMRLGGDNLVV